MTGQQKEGGFILSHMVLQEIHFLAGTYGKVAFSTFYVYITGSIFAGQGRAGKHAPQRV